MAGAAAEWRAAVASRRVDVEAWERLASECAREQADLVSRGMWVSGPSDLMTVLGAQRNELAHSNVVAWLLSPAGRHALGNRLLLRLLEEGWSGPAFPSPPGEVVVVDREIVTGTRRADVVVRVDGVILVIENKVDAPESPGQCEDLYRLWLGAGPDVRFLLLSPSGRPPQSTRSAEAAEAWRSMSYRSLVAALELVAEHPGRGGSSAALRQYASTLVRAFPRRESFSITVGGGHIDD